MAQGIPDWYGMSDEEWRRAEKKFQREEVVEILKTPSFWIQVFVRTLPVLVLLVLFLRHNFS
ncbi:MAG: hypothetical protein Q7R89_04120 [bacterium]|nr:hypothetical protein [bacterium]